MSYFLMGLALIIAMADWYAVAKKWKNLEYIAKPGVIVALIIWLIIQGGYLGPTAFFLLGLIFSLAGDIFLMLPEERFITGLVSFLLAHLAYIRGFTISEINFSTAGVVVIGLVGLAGLIVLRRVLEGLNQQNQEKLRFPVILYTIIICTMLITALFTLVMPGSSWEIYAAILVSLGAFLFFFSDSVLAWNKFVDQIRHGKLLVIIPYHLAQITITLGVGINFLS